MRVDEHAAEAFHTETFDETHAAHVGGQIVYHHRAFAGALAVPLLAHVQREILCVGNMQIQLVKRFLVHRTDVGETPLLEIERKVAGNEAAGAGDYNQIILLQRGVSFCNTFLAFHKLLFPFCHGSKQGNNTIRQNGSEMAIIVQCMDIIDLIQ